MDTQRHPQAKIILFGNLPPGVSPGILSSIPYERNVEIEILGDFKLNGVHVVMSISSRVTLSNLQTIFKYEIHALRDFDIQ